MLNLGLIITYPYGTYIKNKKKNIIVKSKKFNTISNCKMLLIEDKVGLGIIILDDPYQINLNQFKKLYPDHLITDSDRKTWWPNYKILYVYNIINIKIFTKPILLDYKSGPQVTIYMHNIIFKNIYIGTCGFIVKQQQYKLNSVEINTTFYKYPTDKLILNLSKLNLIYSIKVSQIITHFKQLLNVEKLWKSFYKLFDPIKLKIKCFLFQFNDKFLPNFNTLNKIKKFSKLLDNKHHYVFEFRNEQWFNQTYIDYINNLGIKFCSLFSPHVNLHVNLLTKYQNIFYLRLHGTLEEMYKGKYTNAQLSKIYDYIKYNQIHESYIYFNNTDDDNAITNSITFYNKFNTINIK